MAKGKEKASLPSKAKDGSYSLRSKSHVRAAIERIALLDAEVEELRVSSGIEEREDERAALRTAIDKYVLDGHDYEDEDMKITRVQGFRRRWDVKKLEAILPRGIFKNVVKVEVDPAKLDEYVRKGKVDRDAIEPAFEETPNAPYSKWTEKSDKDRGKTEADSLAKALS